MDADNNYSEPVQHAIPASSIHPSLPKSTITKRNIKAKKGVSIYSRYPAKVFPKNCAVVLNLFMQYFGATKMQLVLE